MKKLILLSIKIFLFVFIFCSAFNSFSQDQSKIDSLINELKTAIEDTSKIKLYLKIGKQYRNTIPDTALFYYQKALNIAQSQKKQKTTANIYIKIGIVCWKKGDYQQAIDYYQKALKIYSDIEDKVGISRCLGNLGLIHDNQGNYDKALEYYQKALKISEELGKKNSVGILSLNIGLLYSNQENYNKAMEFYNRSLEIFKNIEYKAGTAAVIGNIGINYHKQGNYNKALEFYQKAIAISEELGDKNGIALNLANIGVVYKEQGDYKMALKYYQKALIIFEELGYKNSIAINLGNIASLYNKLEQHNKAILFANRALKISKEIGALDNEKHAYLNLSDAYKGLNNYKKALVYKNKFIDINDSIFNNEKTKAIAEMSTRYETEKKEQQIALQEAQLAKKDLEIKQQKTLRNALISGLGAFVIIILLVVYAYFQKKKANIKITKQKDVIEKQKEEITDSIRYAKRIQTAVLPPHKIITESLPDHFVLFKPKDIVSGDFYWMKKLNGFTVIAAVDCTGHGVPGAFMSMLGIAFLNEIVRKIEVTKACDVLNEMRYQIKTTLRQEGKEGEAKDGMDIALCVIDHKNMKLQFSGAYNPLYLYRKNAEGFVLNEVKADRMPIGIYVNEKESFTNHEIKLQKDDSFYIFSDGYADQIGGKNNRKFMTKNFKKLLLEIQGNSMPEQKEKLETTITDWMQDEEQVDDILIIGIKI